MKKALTAFSIACLAITAAPAAADPPPWAPAHGKRAQQRDFHRDRIYDARGRYIEPRRIDRNSRVWRGRDGRYYCKRNNGTTGLIIGAGVGALAGHQIAGSGDRTLGAVLGGVLGGALGREIDRGRIQCR